MNVQRNKGPIYFVSYTIWVQLAAASAYLFTSFYLPDLNYTPLIIAGVSLINLCCIIVIKPYKDTLRVLFNQLILFLIFLCYFVIREIEAANWSGFAILVLLYLQVIVNFIIIGRSVIKNHDKMNYEQDDDEDEEENEEHDPNMKD